MHLNRVILIYSNFDLIAIRNANLRHLSVIGHNLKTIIIGVGWNLIIRKLEEG